MKKVISLCSAVALLAAMAACGNPSAPKQGETIAVSAQTKSAELAADTLIVQGSCEMCKSRIEKAANELEGIAAAAWDKDTKTLRFSYDASKTSVEALSKSLAQAGHDTDKDRAEEAVYEALPGCCKYRK